MNMLGLVWFGLLGLEMLARAIYCVLTIYDLWPPFLCECFWYYFSVSVSVLLFSFCYYDCICICCIIMMGVTVFSGCGGGAVDLAKVQLLTSTSELRICESSIKCTRTNWMVLGMNVYCEQTINKLHIHKHISICEITIVSIWGICMYVSVYLMYVCVRVCVCVSIWTEYQYELVLE